MPLSLAYALLMNKVRVFQDYNGINMTVLLENDKDTDDVSENYVDTPFKGVKALRIRIVIDKFLKETQMGTLLDDIRLLEKKTDFLITEISKDNNQLIVKGEVYGI